MKRDHLLRRKSRTGHTRAIATLLAPVLLLSYGYLTVCAKAAPARRQHQHANEPEKPPSHKEPVRLTIPDVEALNQDGQKIHFYEDLIRGKVVVVSFIFTTCASFCPLQGEALNRFQAALGNRLGKDVNIICVSIDPETDTPERLRAWGTRFGARPGWTLVTGKKVEIDKIAMALTGAPAMKGGHEPVMFIGDNEKGNWVRVHTLIETDRFMKIIESMLSTPAAQDLRKSSDK